MFLVVNLRGDVCAAYHVQNETEANVLAEIVFETGNPEGGCCDDCGALVVSCYEPHEVTDVFIMYEDGQQIPIIPLSRAA
ncbi:MAG: hypothetical protein NXI22_17410 [bacterium]|nr:hypothetical protein [bacterium]